MSNSARGEVVIIINNRQYEMIPSFDNLSLIESELNQSILLIARKIIAGTITLNEIISIIYNSIDFETTDHPITKAEIGNLIIENGLNKFITYITEFFHVILNGEYVQQTGLFNSYKKKVIS